MYKQALENISYSDLVAIWNEYTEANRYDDDRIFYRAEFDDLFANADPSTVARAVWGGAFNPREDYFKFDVWGDCVSAEDPTEFIDLEDLCAWLEGGGFDALPRYLRGALRGEM